ncbi:potential fungal zinc cluster transcription factor [Ceraceosorus bombacis]|uniref:Transcription activator of gluconeogenesis ERT1 n=1 Tax=Ceraceosorus bombacis TaxID=401625 RepID=A0A0P1BIB7_9BASI|nr:potential fungal zinc cluster transcription factor [Ceraceosorus bombacis]
MNSHHYAQHAYNSAPSYGAQQGYSAYNQQAGHPHPSSATSHYGQQQQQQHHSQQHAGHAGHALYGQPTHHSQSSAPMHYSSYTGTTNSATSAGSVPYAHHAEINQHHAMSHPHHAQQAQHYSAHYEHQPAGSSHQHFHHMAGVSGMPAPSSAAQAGPKPKRRQVKNACVNCQKACKKCDEGRPCSRCVKYGLTDSCQDSSRKERKRGIKRGPYKRRANGSSEQSGGHHQSRSTDSSSGNGRGNNDMSRGSSDSQHGAEMSSRALDPSTSYMSNSAYPDSAPGTIYRGASQLPQSSMNAPSTYDNSPSPHMYAREARLQLPSSVYDRRTGVESHDSTATAHAHQHDRSTSTPIGAIGRATGSSPLMHASGAQGHLPSLSSSASSLAYGVAHRPQLSSASSNGSGSLFSPPTLSNIAGLGGGASQISPRLQNTSEYVHHPPPSTMAMSATGSAFMNSASSSISSQFPLQLPQRAKWFEESNPQQSHYPASTTSSLGNVTSFELAPIKPRSYLGAA